MHPLRGPGVLPAGAPRRATRAAVRGAWRGVGRPPVKDDRLLIRGTTYQPDGIPRNRWRDTAWKHSTCSINDIDIIIIDKISFSNFSEAPLWPPRLLAAHNCLRFPIYLPGVDHQLLDC